MTLADLRAQIERHAPGSLIPRDWLLTQISDLAGNPLDVVSWVDTERAAEITGEQPEHLRHRAVAWRGMPDPRIRVTKNDEHNHLSRWLFAEVDCWTYARDGDKMGPKGHTDGDREVDPDDPHAIADSYLERVGL